MLKEENIKILLEDILGLYKNNESIIIQEVLNSTEDPEFKKMANYFTRFSSSKKLFNNLGDKDKLKVLNKVDAIINGSGIRSKYSSTGTPDPVEQAVVNILASEYVRPQEEYGDWSPDYIDTNNINSYILIYYSPYGSNSSDLSKVAEKAIPPSYSKKNFDPDIVIEAFHQAFSYLLRDKKYNPNESTFDFALVQLSWRNKIQTLKDASMKTFEPKASAEDSDYDSEREINKFGYETQKEPQLLLKTDKEKFEFLLNQLNDSDQKILKGFYNFIFSDSDNQEEASKKIIDTLYDVDGDLEKYEEDELDTEGKKNLYYFISQQMGPEDGSLNIKTLKSKTSALRQKLFQLFKDPKFKDVMGLQDWSEKELDILKATRGKSKKTGQKYSQKKFSTGGYTDEPSVPYDKYGRPIEKDDLEKIFSKFRKGKNLDEFMYESIDIINSNFNYRFKKIDGTLKKINNLNQIVNEGFEVAVKDLDQDIYKYINNAIENLQEANYVLNELEAVGEDIKLEFPEVSQKLHEIIMPLVDDLMVLINKIKNVKQSMKPYLSESKLDEMDLEEERITNPESKEFVKNRENFIGSHIYGEDLGGLGKMYVAYSYGEQFPAYVWHNDKWYHNTDNYVLDDGTVNEPTNQHKEDMRPAQDTHGLSTIALNTMIRKFKNKHDLGDNVHTDVEPGEKN